MKNKYKCYDCLDFPCECSTDFDKWKPTNCIFNDDDCNWVKVEE